MHEHIRDSQLVAMATATPDTQLPTGGDRHLANCAECRRRLRQYEQTLAFASQLPAPAWNALQCETLVHRVRQRLRTRQRPTPVWRPALGGALVALLAVLTVQSLLGTPTGRTAAGTTAAQSAAEAGAVPLAGIRVGRAEVALPETPTPASDDELAQWIDNYLIDTASEDELIGHLGAIPDEDLVAVFESQ